MIPISFGLKQISDDYLTLVFASISRITSSAINHKRTFESHEKWASTHIFYVLAESWDFQEYNFSVLSVKCRNCLLQAKHVEEFHRYFPDDFQILPSSDITMTVTSSWYFLRSPCGMSSNSWKSIPVENPSQDRIQNPNMLWTLIKCKERIHLLRGNSFSRGNPST